MARLLENKDVISFFLELVQTMDGFIEVLSLFTTISRTCRLVYNTFEEIYFRKFKFMRTITQESLLSIPVCIILVNLNKLSPPITKVQYSIPSHRSADISHPTDTTNQAFRKTNQKESFPPLP